MTLFIISVIKGKSFALMLLFTISAICIRVFVWIRHEREGLKDVLQKLNCPLLCVLQQSGNLKTESLWI